MPRAKKIPYLKVMKKYNIRKGYGGSVRKAMIKAIEEESKSPDDLIINYSKGVVPAFLTYALFKSFLRFYKWVVREIYFKRGKTKFLLYTLDVFTQGEGRKAYDEVKKELLVVAHDTRK